MDRRGLRTGVVVSDLLFVAAAAEARAPTVTGDAVSEREDELEMVGESVLERVAFRSRVAISRELLKHANSWSVVAVHGAALDL